MIALALLLQTAAANPQTTVGDTVWVERVLGEVGTATVRPQPWSLGDLGEQLSPAEVLQGARGTTVRYALVLWYAGDRVITMPGPVLVHKDGSSDTLATSSYRVSIQSVLPPGVARSTLAPKPVRNTLTLTTVSWTPLIVLTGWVLLAVAAVAYFWRRRGKPVVRPATMETLADPDVLERWAAAGELRTALEGWSWHLARRLARSADLAEMAAAQEVLEGITDQLYVPGSTERLTGLARRAAALTAAR